MDDWMSPTEESWVAMHVLYQNMRKGGFSRWESALLLVAMMQSGKEFPDEN